VTLCQLVCLASLHESLQLCLVLVVSQLKRQLFDFDLSLEEVNWIFKRRLRDAIDGYSEPVHLERFLKYIVIQLIDESIKLLFEATNPVLVGLFHFKAALFNEVFEVLRVLEVHGCKLAVNDHARLALGARLRDILVVLVKLDEPAPLLTVNIDHELLKVLQNAGVLR